ncbi:MAG: YraN family protein [Brevundimonas sp.]|uniref:YraN family protein n=1 Tax=Brevundimonas sp. TaxID=1871086 RepID=UPI001211F5D8|nr:YraN family protein [Brevundimonas sp.]RZJ16298.1 MAG: YraN family protein [Brevundimonas sp.]
MSESLRPAPSPKRPKAGWRQVLGGRARRQGHDGEWLAALWLMLKGYQVLAFRLKGRGGEVDILARRGRVLAVVEVKRRRTLDAALLAIHPEQLRRLRAAGAAVARGRRSLAGLDVRLDMVALAPGRFPRHVRGIEATEG